MAEKPSAPHHIKSEHINIPADVEKKEPTKKFGTLKLTKKEFRQFLDGFVKMMLSLIKKGEKTMIKAMKKIGDPDHPD